MAGIITSTAEIIQEVKKPGKVYINMLVSNDVAYIKCDKSDLIKWLQNRIDMSDCGVYASREADGLYIVNS